MNHIYILIHGTWSDHRGNWSLPQGEFFQELSLFIPEHATIVPFLWSGKNSHIIRRYTATALAQLIKSYPLSTNIHIIAHSHGANIGFLASQILAKDAAAHKITSFFALGAPINTNLYTPAANIIQHGWNIFSTKDTVQPIFGNFKRTLDPCWNFYNIRLFFGLQEPEHFQLHSPLVARWIASQINTPQAPLSAYNQITLWPDKPCELLFQDASLFNLNTTKGFFYTLSTAFQLAHYKVRSIKRSRLQRKKTSL